MENTTPVHSGFKALFDSLDRPKIQIRPSYTQKAWAEYIEKTSPSTRRRNLRASLKKEEEARRQRVEAEREREVAEWHEAERHSKAHQRVPPLHQAHPLKDDWAVLPEEENWPEQWARLHFGETKAPSTPRSVCPLKRRSYIIDCQLFVNNDWELFIKEFALMRDDGVVKASWLIRRPYPYGEQIEEVRHRNDWWTNTVHGIGWEDGDFDLVNVRRSALRHLDGHRLFATKEAAPTLRKFLRREVETVEGISLRDLWQKLPAGGAGCRNHSGGAGNSCALEVAMAIQSSHLFY